jgi:hypothetical protein
LLLLLLHSGDSSGSGTTIGGGDFLPGLSLCFVTCAYTDTGTGRIREEREGKRRQEGGINIMRAIISHDIISKACHIEICARNSKMIALIKTNIAMKAL